ncbi:MAG TPA: helix-turn-helix domain-containing protein [Thermoplasmata archaeon]|nr:helix-turn-helix domain-containing protein [Thermoplasmata archaeon]
MTRRTFTAKDRAILRQLDLGKTGDELADENGMTREEVRDTQLQAMRRRTARRDDLAPRRHARYLPAIREEALRLAREGLLTYRQIAEQLGTSQDTVSYWVREAGGIERKPDPKVVAFRADVARRKAEREAASKARRNSLANPSAELSAEILAMWAEGREEVAEGVIVRKWRVYEVRDAFRKRASHEAINRILRGAT